MLTLKRCSQGDTAFIPVSYTHLAEIKGIAEAYNVSITDAQVDQLLSLCRSLEKLDIAQLQDKLVSLTQTLEGAKKVESKFTEFANSIKAFFEKVADFFARLFGGGQ